jgi:hypothetical protein
MEQRPNDATLTDVRMLLKREEYASNMGAKIINKKDSSCSEKNLS